jgi:hypothetical protein
MFSITAQSGTDIWRKAPSTDVFNGMIHLLGIVTYTRPLTKMMMQRPLCLGQITLSGLWEALYRRR